MRTRVARARCGRHAEPARPALVPDLVESIDPVYAPGQVWAYHTRPGEEGSTLTVLRVERIVPVDQVIVHVAESVALVDPAARGGAG